MIIPGPNKVIVELKSEKETKSGIILGKTKPEDRRGYIKAKGTGCDWLEVGDEVIVHGQPLAQATREENIVLFSSDMIWGVYREEKKDNA